MVIQISHIVISIRFYYSKFDHSIFIRNSYSNIVILAIYVDDILLICKDIQETTEIKKYLHFTLVTKILEDQSIF